MKTRVLCSILLLTIFFQVNSQSFLWAKRAGLWAYDMAHGISTDNSGNIYVAGKFEMNASFGSSTVICAGNHDIFLAKYDSTGAFQWVRTAGGIDGDDAHAVASDGDGNVYITGEMEA